MSHTAILYYLYCVFELACIETKMVGVLVVSRPTDPHFTPTFPHFPPLFGVYHDICKCNGLVPIQIVPEVSIYTDRKYVVRLYG